MKALWLGFATVMTLGCARGEMPPKAELRLAVAAPAPPIEAVVERTVPDPVLEGAPIEHLDLGGGEDAWVALPVGATDRRPIVVGVHGAGDRPDWACTEWQAVTAGWAIVVCPRSRWAHPQDDRTYVWGSAEQIAASADRAVAAVRARYATWTLDTPLVYAGWSQGGTLASEVIRSRPGMYDRAVLVEVGHTALDAGSVVGGFLAGGVKRAVVSCESPKCRAFAQTFDRAARRRGLAFKVTDSGFRAHVFDERVYRALAPQFGWMFEDDARYVGLAAAIDARWATD